jgi:hypothetical protein
MIRKLMAVLAAALVLLAAEPAEAATVLPPGAAHKIGSTYQERVSTGEVLTFRQVNEVESVALVSRRSLGQCSWTYFCQWDSTNYDGEFHRYSLNGIAGAPGHCWQLSNAARDDGESWWNDTNTDVRVYDWVNCNASGWNRTVAASGYATCQSSDWCDRVTSLYACGRFTTPGSPC